MCLYPRRSGCKAKGVCFRSTDLCHLRTGPDLSSDKILIYSFLVQALPTLLKLSALMANKKHEWQLMRQLPVEIELDKGFQFHSIFACPVSRDQSTAENPPMLLPCGHVLCKHSIQKLAKGHNRTFKCPYCPSETTISLCRQIQL